jgi:hypothetical protein
MVYAAWLLSPYEALEPLLLQSGRTSAADQKAMQRDCCHRRAHEPMNDLHCP